MPSNSLPILMVMILLFFCHHRAMAQPSDPIPREIKDWIEQLSGASDLEYDYRTITEDLYHFLQEPLDINQANAEDFSRLHLLPPYQIHSLLRYRNQYGSFLSIYELPMVYGFTVELVKRLEPFIKAGKLQEQGL